VSDLDLLIHRYFERNLSEDEERSLWNRIAPDPRAADRFVEYCDLESGLVERFASGRSASVSPVVRVARRAGALLEESSLSVGLAEDAGTPDPACAQELHAAWQRRADRIDPAAHRDALRRCLVLLEGELRTILHGRYALGLDCAAIAENDSRSTEEIDTLVFRMKKLLVDLVRMRLAVLGDGP
jgi:hypothetical protein